MQFIHLLLVLLGASVARAHFETGNSFPGDCKKREDTCKPLVTCPNKGSSSSSGSSESSGDTPSSQEATTGLPSGSGSGNPCDLSGEWGASGSGNGSWEISGSGSGNCSSGSGSGSEEISGSGIGSGIGSGDSSGSGGWEEGQYCFLLEVFLNYSIILDVDIRIIFIEWINTTQITIVEDSSLTEYQILVQIWYSLQILFEQYQEIEIAIKYLYIGDWGYVCDLEGLASDIQTDYAEITLEEVIEIDVSTGSCPLIAALQECSQNATSTEQAEIEVLIGKITVIINGYYSFSETLVLIYQEFSSFFIQYPDLEALIFSAEIEEFGILESFFDITNVYWRIEYFSVAVGGSTSSCELLISLDDLWQNTSYSNSQRQDFKQLYTKISAYFEIEVSVELRIQYFAEQLYQLLILAEWDLAAIYQVEISGYGCIYDLIYAYIYQCNHGVGPGDFTVSEEPSTSTVVTTPTTVTSTSTSTSTSTPTSTSTSTSTPTSTSTSTSTSTPTTTKTSTTPSTTVPTTTKTSTSTSTSTTTKPSTTPAPVCANAWSVNIVKNSTTDLLSSIIAAQSTWSASDKNVFLGYQKKIYAISSNTTASYTTWWKFSDIKKVLLNFASSSTTVYQSVQAVYIVNWGYVSSYCSCATSGNNVTQG